MTGEHLHRESVAGRGVNGEGHPRVGVPETNLGRLHVDPPDDQRRGVQVPQIVEACPLAAGGLGGRQPDPATPVRIAQRTALIVGEDQSPGVPVASGRRAPGEPPAWW